MEFGRVEESELNNINFKLPEEPTFNSGVLSGKKNANPKVYLGCAKWGRTEWIGKIYPTKEKEKDFLQHYVQHYNSIELNATHYKFMALKALQNGQKKQEIKILCFVPKCIRV